MSKILVTGGTGLVGHAVGALKHEAVLIGSEDYDLRDITETDKMFRKYQPDTVIHLAGKVGGVKANTQEVANFFFENILINTNVIHGCYLHGVKKLVSLMSTCIYPDKVEYPIKETSLHNGDPHPSNFGYAHSKRMIDVQSRAYRQQYGCNFVTLIPNNIYGPYDNFHLENGHVIPALIRKFYNAVKQNKTVELWGSGEALRQFSFSINIASAILWAVEHYHEAEPLNIGNPSEHSIKEVAELIASYLAYDREIIWNTTQPEGQFRKTASFEKLAQTGYHNKWTSLEAGLEQTCEWYKRSYPDVRGII